MLLHALSPDVLVGLMLDSQPLVPDQATLDVTARLSLRPISLHQRTGLALSNISNLRCFVRSDYVICPLAVRLLFDRDDVIPNNLTSSQGAEAVHM